MAPSSSAKKVAKLASRGRGKKVRFQSGTTFPVVLTAVAVAMLLLITYARVSMPSPDAGSPQPGDAWSQAYGIRVCNEWLPNLTGSKDELKLDASTGDLTKVATGTDADGIIHYHAQTGGNTGKKARLGVFLKVYGVKLSDTTLELPKTQVGAGETSSWDVSKFKCNGKDTQIRVRVWKDYSKNDFVDNVTDFSSLRFTNNGMVFAIAIVPKGDDIAKPDSASKLSGLGVIGSGTTTTVAATGTTVAATGRGQSANTLRAISVETFNQPAAILPVKKATIFAQDTGRNRGSQGEQLWFGENPAFGASSSASRSLVFGLAIFFCMRIFEDPCSLCINGGSFRVA